MSRPGRGAAAAADLWAWRHPRVDAAAGRCIGRTDLPVDARRAKRLAHRIRAAARRHDLPRELWVSPLGRARAVGRWLARWGWRVQVDARLAELDFGRWDGEPWDRIARSEVQAWQADLLHHAPGGGESLAALVDRVRAFVAEHAGTTLVVTHGGWLNALRLPRDLASLAAADWRAAPPHGMLIRWR